MHFQSFVWTVQFAELLNLEQGAGPSGTASKFAGGELRLEKGGSIAYVALAAPVTGSTSVKVTVTGTLSS